MAKKEHNYYVYILSNKPQGVLYIGMTNGLIKRNFQHTFKKCPNSFTAKYNINRLVYYEYFPYVNAAISREKQLKNWHRQWKINLIEKDNPKWKNLLDEMI